MWRLAGLCSLCFSAPGLAQPGSEAVLRLVDFGVICEVEMTGQRDAPMTESGTLNLIESGREIDVTTAIVPAALGLSFGIRSEAVGAFAGDVRVVVTHPPIGVRGVAVESWTTPLGPGAPLLNLFSFEHDYELAPGAWTFALVVKDETLVSQRFEVVEPVVAPHVMDICFPAVPVS